jgi:hypothetical protein
MTSSNENVYRVMQLFVAPPQPGERIIVSGWEHLEVKVSKVELIKSECRHKIFLDWGEHGTSHVYDHDEGKVWRRYLDVN